MVVSAFRPPNWNTGEVQNMGVLGRHKAGQACATHGFCNLLGNQALQVPEAGAVVDL